MSRITIKPVKVHCIKGMRTMYDVCLDGKPVRGSRHYRQSDALVEGARMQSYLDQLETV